MSQPFVVDTSALLALIEDEPGAQRVEEVLLNETVLLPWVALLELYYITLQECTESEAQARCGALVSGPAEVVWTADQQTLLTAARWKARHRISLADSVIAAVAHQKGAILVHKDPE